MDFSVLLSVYHKEQPSHLKECLESIFNQTVKSNDVILVEDGKLTDDLEKLINDYERSHKELHVIRHGENRGLGRALNDGIRYCRNELIARMDADDIAKPQRFEKQIAFFKAHPDYDLCGSWVDEFIDNNQKITSVRKVPESPLAIYNFAKYRCPVNHPTVMYKKTAVEKVGGYQTKYLPEDYFLWIKMLMNGSKFYNLQESLLWFRYNPQTFARRGGWKYAKDELATQINCYKLGFLSLPSLIRNVFIRFTVRILPNKVRSLIYKYFLRR